VSSKQPLASVVYTTFISRPSRIVRGDAGDFTKSRGGVEKIVAKLNVPSKRPKSPLLQDRTTDRVGFYGKTTATRVCVLHARPKRLQ